MSFSFPLQGWRRRQSRSCRTTPPPSAKLSMQQLKGQGCFHTPLARRLRFWVTFHILHPVQILHGPPSFLPWVIYSWSYKPLCEALGPSLCPTGFLTILASVLTLLITVFIVPHYFGDITTYRAPHCRQGRDPFKGGASPSPAVLSPISIGEGRERHLFLFWLF